MEIEFLKWIDATFHSQGWLNYIMKYITYIGEFAAVPIACALILLIFKRTRKGGFIATIALIFNLLIVNALLKTVINRPRPWAEFEEIKLFYEQFEVRLPTDSSFPSGHTAACFCVAVACVCAFRMKGTPALVVAFLVALSRLYLCVHYPTDVLAGALIGSACGVAGYFTAMAIIKKFSKAKVADNCTEQVEEENTEKTE